MLSVVEIEALAEIIRRRDGQLIIDRFTTDSPTKQAPTALAAGEWHLCHPEFFEVFPDDWLAPRLDGRSQRFMRDIETRCRTSSSRRRLSGAVRCAGNVQTETIVFSNSGEPNFVGAGFSGASARHWTG